MDKDEQVNKVLEGFNFNKVHQIIKVVTDGSDVPTVEELKGSAEKALGEVVYSNKFETSNAGFKAKQNLNGVLSLKFDVELRSVVQ